MSRRSWPLLLVAAAALIAGGVKAWGDGSITSPLAVVMFTAGLIVLGAWLAMEIANRIVEPQEDIP